ncbi:MAG: FG-GAP-like repeat-containing protein, partial [Pyrinomonadaceae bacterium]
ATMNISNSTFQDNNLNVDLGSSGTAVQTIDVNTNTILRAASNSVNIVGDGVINGKLNNNRIGSGAVDSGSRDAYDIGVSQRGNPTWKLSITNNVLRNSDFEGLFVRIGDFLTGDTGVLDLTVTNNTIFAPDDNSGFPAFPRGMMIRTRQATSLCVNLATNESQGNGAEGYRLQRSDTSQYRMQGFNSNALTTTSGNGNKTGGAVPTVSTAGEPFQGACTAVVPPIPPAVEEGSAPSFSGLESGPTPLGASDQPPFPFLVVSLPLNGPIALTSTAPKALSRTLPLVGTRAIAVALTTPGSGDRSGAVNPLTGATAVLFNEPSAHFLSDFTGSLISLIEPTAFAQRVNSNPLVSQDNVKRPESGENINIAIGTLPAGKSLTVVFKATLSPSLGYSQVSNQGTISGSNFANVLTDDPGVAGAANPTVTQIAAPDLTATKTNNVSGTRPLNSAWNWTIAVANGGTDDAVFTSGQTVFNDNLPDTNIIYGAPTTNNANVSCTINGSFNLVCTAGASGLTLTGPGGTFNITVPVTGASVVGAYVNPRSGGGCAVDPNAVIDEGANEGNNTCANTVNVFAPPTVVKSFLPTTVSPGGISTLSIQITNPAANPAPLTGIGFTDTFPAGLQVAASPLATNTCSGAFAPAGGNTTITLGASSLNAGASCTVTVKVTPTTGGAKINNVTVASTQGGNANVATATLSVGKAPLDFDGDGTTDYAVVRDSGLPQPNGLNGPTASDSDQDSEPGEGSTPRDGTLGSMHRGYYFKLPGEKFDPLMPRLERPDAAAANQLRWLINTSGPTADLNILFGTLNDFPVPADYDGDGICDVAVWTGGVGAQFRVLTSASGFVTTVTYTLGNLSSDPSVIGDYDGDGKADPAIMNANTGQFTYLGGATHATSVTVTPIGAFGGGFPVPGDYDGDGKYDFVLETRDGINPTQAHFYRWTNTGSLTPAATDNFVFGNYRDVIIPGDYDGDGKTDIGLASSIVNPMAWRIRVTPTGTLLGPFNLGDPNVDYTITGDYNGDQKGEITIWHPAGTVQFQSLLAPAYAGPTTNFSWGQSGDYPVAYFNSH